MTFTFPIRQTSAVENSSVYVVYYGDRDGEGYDKVLTEFVRCNKSQSEIEALKERLKAEKGIDIDTFGAESAEIPENVKTLAADFLCGEPEFEVRFMAELALHLLQQPDPTLQYEADVYPDELCLGSGYAVLYEYRY